jgi:glucose/arabinose dehydrogenase
VLVGSVPMTDTKKYPHALRARWSSGFPTVAPGATFITGARWGSYQGVLAIGLLKDTGVLLLTISSTGVVTKTARMTGVQDTYGRLRAPQMGPDGVLYVTTSNGEGQDKILRIVPNRM